MNKNKIKQLSVLIMNEEGAAIGSGTLFVPKENGEYAYIYTASHIIKEENREEKKLKFKMLVNEEEMEFETKDEESIKCHKGYSNDSEVREYDVAVIKVQKEEWMIDLPTLTIGKPKENDNINGQGYPKNAHEGNLQFAMFPLEGKIGACSDKYMRAHVQLSNNLNPIERDEELKGYSGSGIYEKSEYCKELVLLGIFSYGQGYQAMQGFTNIFNSGLLLDICRENGWDEPEENTEFPKSFKPYAYDATKIIENSKTRESIEKLINYFIEINLEPKKLINTPNTMSDIPQCNNEDRTRCKECWTARLQLISILSILKVNVDDFKLPQISINGQDKIPIDFFCSEGSKGESQMRQVIHSIIDSDYILNGNFRENAVLVWASTGKQTKKIMKRSEFNNVVIDICDDLIYRVKGYDTLYGEKGTNNLSIVHIDELMAAVDAKELDISISNLLEVIENVIR